MIQEQIAEKINLLKQVEDLLPAITVVHDLQTSSVLHMSGFGLKYLGTSLLDLQEMGAGYHDRFFNPEFARLYVPRLLGLLERNNNDEVISYFQQVRANPNEEWRWCLSGTDCDASPCSPRS